MLELPLFPLNTVLFPGSPIRLHIFEERYKRMIALCLATRQPFGVVMIRRGAEASGPLAEPYTIGCSAQIIQVQRLEEGRMNIAGVGLERFRIISLDMHAQPYLVGIVEPFPLANPDPQGLKPAERRLREWVSRYVAAIAKANAGQVDIDQLPADPQEFIYAAAGLLQISPADKQGLLTMETAAELLMGVTALYKREVALARTIFNPGPEVQGAFSLN
jgi:uncharacterized protein